MKLHDYHIAIGNATGIGKVRGQNEDYMAHFTTPMGYCIIICDGMGGHAGGKVASQTATSAIQQYLQDPRNDSSDVPLGLKNAIEFSNYQLREMVNKNPELKGMGTTCVMALIKDGKLYTAHAGDSRIYLVRDGSIRQMTKDHSSVQKLIDMGTLTEEEAELSDKKNEINKAIGIFDKVEPAVTVTPLPLHKNDKILLCSDGLTAHVAKNKIGEIISSCKDLQLAALKLVEQANNEGGSDNITVQLIRYTGANKVTGKRIAAMKKTLVVISGLIIIGCLAIWIIYNNKGVNKFPHPATKDSAAEKKMNQKDPVIKIEAVNNPKISPK